MYWEVELLFRKRLASRICFRYSVKIIKIYSRITEFIARQHNVDFRKYEPSYARKTEPDALL